MIQIELIALLASAALDPTTAQAVDQSPKAEAAAKPEEKKVCRRVVPTGSIMAERTCRTQKQWNELTDSGQETLKQTRERSQATMGAPAN